MNWFLRITLVIGLACTARGQDPSSSPDPVPSATESLATPDEQIGEFFDRYLWVVGESTGHRASLGIGMFVLLALIIMMSARLANLDGVSFGRGAICSACILTTASLEIALVPGVPAFVALACFVNIIAWFGLVRGLLGGDVYNGIVMLVAVSFAVMLIMLGLQIAGTLLHRSELMS